jgi:hypothetical protein
MSSPAQNPQQALLAAQTLSEAHVQTLRTGKMLPPQQAFLLTVARDSRLGLIIFSALAVLIFLNGPLIAGALQGGMFIGVFLLFFLLASIGLAITFFLERRGFRKDALDGKVHIIEGAFRFDKEPIPDRDGQPQPPRCFLLYQRERLSLAEPLRKLGPLLTEGPTYRAFLSPRTRQVLAIEVL